MQKRRVISSILLVGIATLMLILSMSFFGAEGFKWFQGFTWSTQKAKNSISNNTTSLIVVGIGLSIAGTSMQGITRNSLASAYSLGTMAAAALSMIITNYVFNISNGIICVLITICFTMLISSIFLMITFSPKVSSSKVIVIGLIFSIFLSSITYILRDKFNITSEMISFFAVDHLSATWSAFYITAPIILLGSLYLLIMGRRIQIFESDPDKAKSLGVNKNKLRVSVSFTVVLVAAACVYLIGPITFIGILMPQLSKMVLGPGASTRKIMLLSIPISMIILLGAQMLTRKLYNISFTINVLIAIIAGPLIIYKLVRSENE